LGVNVFEFQGLFSMLAFYGLLALKVFAFVSALRWSAPAYEAADKLTKPAWVALTGIGLAQALIFGGVLGLLSVAFTIAALVYVLDVRPALAEVTARR
jgi:hypothetical protein